ncbi:hypothetical protein pb186bvf_002913 [Paramecium bursaria]
MFIGKPQITAVIAGGRRRLNYTFDDKSEVVEEYDMKSHELLSRRIKKQSNIKDAQWIYEVGEAQVLNQEIVPANNNPIFTRKDTAQHFQFRIRNLIYPEEVYQIDFDEPNQEIIIKTTNKKYYKKFQIPDLRRLNLKIEKQLIVHVYKNNTLIISYPKPDQILEREQQIRNEFEKR